MDRIEMLKAVTYYRVSTARQGKSGLGMDAQKEAVEAYVRWCRMTIEKEFFEVESATNNKRHELKRAVRFCKKKGYVLIIAKVDRLTRDAFFAATLFMQKLKIVAADKPLADQLTLLEDAIKAHREVEGIRQRTRDALQAAKRRGVELGKHGKILAQLNKQRANDFADTLAPLILSLNARGIKTQRDLALELNILKIATYRAGCRWHPSSVHTLLKRIKNIKPNVS